MCPSQPSPAQSSAGQQPPRTSDSSSTSKPEHQALYDVFGHADSCADSSLVDSPTAEVEHRNDLGEVIADFLGDGKKIASDKAAVGATAHCWKHGCNGRLFSSRSNLLRHYVEKGKARPKFTCPVCGAYFSRSTARNQHVKKRSCNRIRRYSNGRERPHPRFIDNPA